MGHRWNHLGVTFALFGLLATALPATASAAPAPSPSFGRFHHSPTAPGLRIPAPRQALLPVTAEGDDDLVAEFERWKRLRTTGVVLTAIAGGFMAAGTVIWITADRSGFLSGLDDAIGGGVFGIGVAFLIPGVLTLIRVAVMRKSWEEDYSRPPAAPDPALAPAGILSWRF